MCADNKIIVNRTKDFRSTDRLFVPTGCGDCEECRNKKHYDMYMRMVRECEWAISHGYNMYFSTHTYDDAHLPRTFVPVFDEHWKHIYDDEIICFDSTDWGVYYDSIVKKLRRDYGIGVAGAPKLRYFVACEFGDLRGRSHLHIVWLCPSVCPPAEFYEIVKERWETRGLMFPTKLENGRVWSEKIQLWKTEKPFQVNRVDCNYIKAAYYSSKYACKETFFYSNENVNRYLKHLRYKINGLASMIEQKLGNNDLIDKLNFYKNKLSEFRTHLPFYHCSHGFGLSYLEDFKDLTYKEMYDKLSHGIDSICDNGEIYNFRYPDYIVKKLTQNVYILNDYGETYVNGRDSHLTRYIRRELNDFGKFYKDICHKDKIDNTETMFRDAFVSLTFDKKYLKQKNISLPNIVYDDKFFRNLSIYYCDIRGRVDVRFLKTFNSFKGNNDLVVKNSQNLLEFNSDSVSLLSERKTFGLAATTLLNKLDEHFLYNNNLRFKNYENLIKILIPYIAYERLAKNKVKEITRIKRSKLRHSFYV